MRAKRTHLAKAALPASPHQARHECGNGAAGDACTHAAVSAFCSAQKRALRKAV
eukprot:CAMPEP_0171161762 /NCGR_PEP_ID=MMETSP0790-20130122/4237_1 /TAXON_ID=2925 /ORGANISM="Alexandrium catenella, Strain OF101" /LENGTH=53 /DNA_ID=CAMNT_0011626331 /DNA_START=146 /DNA_END=307 /DNA_ORIENTATION=-